MCRKNKKSVVALQRMCENKLHGSFGQNDRNGNGGFGVDLYAGAFVFLFRYSKARDCGILLIEEISCKQFARIKNSGENI